MDILLQLHFPHTHPLLLSKIAAALLTVLFFSINVENLKQFYVLKSSHKYSISVIDCDVVVYRCVLQESGDDFWTLLSMVISEELCPVDQVKAVSPQTWFHLQQPLLSRGSTTMVWDSYPFSSIHPSRFSTLLYAAIMLPEPTINNTFIQNPTTNTDTSYKSI